MIKSKIKKAGKTVHPISTASGFLILRGAERGLGKKCELAEIPARWEQAKPRDEAVSEFYADYDQEPRKAQTPRGRQEQEPGLRIPQRRLTLFPRHLEF